MTDSAHVAAFAQSPTPTVSQQRLIPLMDGVSREEVEVKDDGTHTGPPQYREADKQFTGSAGMQHDMLAMYCPCGHFIRYVGYDGKPDRVTCSGGLP